MVKLRKERPRRKISDDMLLKIPRRQSNYTLLMDVRLDEIPHWISCPPAVIFAPDLSYF